MSTTPAAPEGLPQYDEEPRADAYAIQAWLQQHLPDRWTALRLVSDEANPKLKEAIEAADRVLITDVIGALLSVGDAQLVKNSTYRALVRDQRDNERLAAGLAKHGLSGRVAEANLQGRTAVDVALRTIDLAAAAVVEELGNREVRAARQAAHHD